MTTTVLVTAITISALLVPELVRLLRRPGRALGRWAARRYLAPLWAASAPLRRGGGRAAYRARLAVREIGHYLGSAWSERTFVLTVGLVSTAYGGGLIYAPLYYLVPGLVCLALAFAPALYAYLELRHRKGGDGR